MCKSAVRRLPSGALALVTLLTTLSLSCAVNAERRGYSVLGGGFSFVDYEENSTLALGGTSIDIETETAAIATQSSGTYVSVDQEWGFYLHTLSTLGVPKSEESWELDETVIRTNSVSFQFQRVELLGSKSIRTGVFRALFGAQYSKFEYRRFGAMLTDAAAGAGVEQDTFDSGTVSETVWDITALAGVEQNTIFTDAGVGWRYQGRALIGIPLLSTIVNTSVANGQSFSKSFNGVEIRGLGILGYQFSKHFFVGASIEASYAKRNSVSRDVASSNGTTEFPSTSFISIFPGLGAYWSF